jgi:hypothetical protein
MPDFRDEEHLPRGVAAERLVDIAYSLVACETLELRHDGERVTVPIADDVLVVRRSTSNGERVEVNLQLSWSAAKSGSSGDS